MALEEHQRRPPPGTRLCSLAEIPDREGREFVFGGPLGFRMFVVRAGDAAFGYVNACPHVRLTLNLMPDRFVGPDKDLIVCSNHGASFRLEDGFCVYGPCAGESLTAVPLELAGGAVLIGGP